MWTKKPYRGIAIVKKIIDGHAELWYPHLNLKVHRASIRYLEKKEF